MSTPAGRAIVETDGHADAGDVLTQTCPRCGSAAEHPDCAKCGFDFTAPSLSTIAEAAARYASKALPIFPLHWITSAGKCSCGGPDCRSPGKHPLTIKGVKDASADAAMVANWWQRWPEANIGLAMGPTSGLFAVDIDPRNGGDVTLEDLEREHGRFPDTLIADTGGGGTHYLFRFDQARRLPGKLGKGIDIKGDGGYIVVEPSNHASGGRYQWRAEADPLEGAEAAQAPAWIFAHGPLSGAAPSASPSAQAGTPAAVGFIPPQQYCDLRSALGAIPSDDRDTWISVLMALRSTDAPNARALAVEWSQLSDKFDAQSFRKTWASLKPDGRIHVESIFKRAEEHGWVNPASRIAQQQAQDQGEAAKGTEAPREPLLRIVSMANLRSAREKRATYNLEPLIPRGVVSLLGAHGGTGKTMLAATICAHVAVGRPWGPFPVKQGRALFVSLEDPGERIRATLARVAEHYALSGDDIEDGVSIIDGSATDSVLAVEQLCPLVGKRLVETAAMFELRNLAKGFDLIVIDNASDAFGGSENERRQVRQFMRGMLGQIARENDAGLLLLAHVDKASAKFGAQRNSYSGSTAWHNSARSRVAILEADGSIELVHEKLNVGRRADPVRLQWTEGGLLEPIAGSAPGDLAGGLIVHSDARAVLDALAAAIKGGASITTARMGSCTTWHALLTYSELPEHLRKQKGKERFWRALAKLERDRRIVAESYRNEDHKTRQRWAIPAQ